MDRLERRRRQGKRPRGWRCPVQKALAQTESQDGLWPRPQDALSLQTPDPSGNRLRRTPEGSLGCHSGRLCGPGQLDPAPRPGFGLLPISSTPPHPPPACPGSRQDTNIRGNCSPREDSAGCVSSPLPVTLRTGTQGQGSCAQVSDPHLETELGSWGPSGRASVALHAWREQKSLPGLVGESTPSRRALLKPESGPEVTDGGLAFPW